jgi:transposase InsO family protein
MARSVLVHERWVYLAVILDLFSRQVVGWAMNERITAALVCDALQMALWRRNRPEGVIVHTDRGSQYCSEAYQRMLRQHGLLCSMSGTGNCYDNACVESFFHSMKIETIHGDRYLSRHDVRQEVFEYIETFYNTTRQHSTLGYVSPAAFEARFAA